MRNMILTFLFTACSLFVASGIVPGVHILDNKTLVLAAVVLGLANVFIRPILIFITIPFTLVTFGLFLFVINVFIYWLTSYLVPGFIIDGFLALILGAIVTSLVNGLLDSMLNKKKK